MTYPWPTLMPMGIVVISCVRPSIQPSMGLGLCIAYKALGRNGLQFGMLMYPDGLHLKHSWMLMDIVVGLSVRPSVHLFIYNIFRWLCICWQITWNKWHKIWHDDVVIIGRWLLPSLVDTGDICCHYWQHILVSHYHYSFYLIESWFLLYNQTESSKLKGKNYLLFHHTLSIVS